MRAGSTAARVAGATIVAWAIAASGAEISRFVRAQVVIVGGLSNVRHEIAISNTGDSRRVVSVLLWNGPGLPEEPKELSAPNGWDVQTLSRDIAGGMTWAVEFRCRWDRRSKAGSRESLHEPSDEDVPCGIGAGQKVKFVVGLPYWSETLEKQAIIVGFSDGRVGIAK